MTSKHGFDRGGSSATAVSSPHTWKSSDPIKPSTPATSRSTPRNGTPIQVKTSTDQRSRYDQEPRFPPDSSNANPPGSPNLSPREHRMSDFGNYRRELAVLDTGGGGGRIPHIQHNPPTATSPPPNQVAPWLSSSSMAINNNGSSAAGSTSGAGAGAGSYSQMSFYDESSDAASQTSQLSPVFRPGTGRTANTTTSESAEFFNDERRPSVASITTASSTGSKGSVSRGGFHKKLQGFFGDDYPGRDGAESTPSMGTTTRKEQRSHSYTRQRERNASNATNTTEKATSGTSPASSRPRTPVPSSDVVPFLYQNSQDIPLYGDAPVREKLTGLDRDRYFTDDNSAPSKQTTSGKSTHGHHKIHLPRHHHHHARPSTANDDRQLRPTLSRESSTPNLNRRDRSGSNAMASVTSSNRAPSPSPSAHSTLGPSSTVTTYISPVSPMHKDNKKGFFGRLKRLKDKDDPSGASLKSLPGSTRSLQTRAELSALNLEAPSRQRSREGSLTDLNFPGMVDNGQFQRPSTSRQATFKFNIGNRRRANDDDSIAPHERGREGSNQALWDLDTNLNDMEGILAYPPPLTPFENTIFTGNNEEEFRWTNADTSHTPGWDAPDSWAVRKVNDDNMSRLPEIDESGAPQTEDRGLPYCIRIFRLDGSFSTLPVHLNATVTEILNQLSKKTWVTDSLENYQIVMRKHDLERILKPNERPVQMQKKLLEQAGYQEKDRLDEVGREDNSYLCRFVFVPTREGGFAAISQDPGLGRVQKFSHIDLSGRNLITIPISLYSRASEIISLNLSRNLSLTLPKDFIQSCINLREIKYVNNESWEVPSSLSGASRLTVLDVSNNKLETLDNSDLNRLQGMLSLKLANNRLTVLPSYFGMFKSLRTLNVSSNFLDEFPEFLCSLKSLVDLDLSFNSINSLPENIGKLKCLERLVITNNRLEKALPDTFNQLVNLREVDIRYNALSSIDIISHLPRVEQVSADHNSVSTFEGSFKKIRVLRLNSNPVTKFDLLHPVPTLTTLILSNAKLAHIPDAAFDKMPNLVKLVLDKNHFVSLPAHIGKLRKLEHFSIARNALSSLPPEIGCLTELHHLDVRENNLKKLPMEIWWANHLETLNVSSNVLDNFPKPGSRPPQAPGETVASNGVGSPAQGPGTPNNPSYEELGPLESVIPRRPSQPTGLLSVGSSPFSDRNNSVVSLYGKGGRKTSVVSRTASSESSQVIPARKDSSMSAKLINTFAHSLKNLYLADNQLDDDCFDELILLSELRILNLSYNDLNDMPSRSIKSWPQLVELYLSGNELTSLPSDDFEEFNLLQVLHINGNRFQTLPAELGKAHKLAVLDCGSNLLKYNVSNWPYDWNWNWNPNLKYLNLSGNKRLEIKPGVSYGVGPASRAERDLTDFSSLQNLRILGLMDVTLTIPMIPDQTEDRRVRTSGSLAGHLLYGMADCLGRNEHLSTIDMVVPRFNSNENETLLGMFDGQALSSGGSKIAKYLHEHFGNIFSEELKRADKSKDDTPVDALRRAFLSLNKDLATAATQHTEERSLHAHRGSGAPALSMSDLHSGGVATVLYMQNSELYVANVGDAQAMLVHASGSHRMLTRKHDPAEPAERQRIRDAGGWVSRQGKLNDILQVSRAFGYVQLMPAVQAAPHITQIGLKETDEMVVIASREMWEYLSPELVCDVALSERRDLMRAAQRLRDLAIAFGATSKIMVMMISVKDLSKRNNRLTRGPTSISMYPSGIPEDAYQPVKRKGKKGDDVSDSTLRRLQAEVQAPIGELAICFTDIKSSTLMWETFPDAMRSAIKLHNEVMRRQLRIIGGYEVKTEGDSFMVSFPTATSSLLWAFSVQSQLLEVPWPSEVLESVLGREIYDSDQNLIFRGLSVRMGIHWGSPVCENDPITRRMDYFGPMVNRASRISSVADGGQITVSADFIQEIQRCLETYNESDRSASTGSEDTFDSDVMSQAIRRELRALSSQGFEVKDVGERKLKGLENPEFIYLTYPHSLAGRMQYQLRMAEGSSSTANGTAPTTANGDSDVAHLAQNSQLREIDAESVWALWSISLRLEMLCSSLEDPSGNGLQPPETALLEKMRSRGGEVTDRFLMNFLTHQISRIESCVSTLATRHLINGKGELGSLNDLAKPMSQVFESITAQLQELQRYKALYGDLTPGDVKRAEEIIEHE